MGGDALISIIGSTSSIFTASGIFPIKTGWSDFGAIAFPLDEALRGATASEEALGGALASLEGATVSAAEFDLVSLTVFMLPDCINGSTSVFLGLAV